jgi:integrase/recombinase XerC
VKRSINPGGAQPSGDAVAPILCDFCFHLRQEGVSWLAGRGLAQRTQQAYADTWMRFFGFLQAYWAEPLTPESLGRVTLMDIRAFLAKRHGSGAGQSTLAVEIAGIKSLNQFWTASGHVWPLALHGLRRPRGRRKLARPLGRTDVMALIEQARPEGSDWVKWRDFALVLLLYASGMRIHEALGLTVSLWGRGQTLYLRGKGGVPRVVPILDKARLAIQSYQDLCPYDRNQNSPLFYGRQGRALQPGVFQRTLRTWRQALGLPCHVTPHSLRHTFASHLLEEGVNLRDLQELLGHSSLASTQRYTQATQAHLYALYKSAQNHLTQSSPHGAQQDSKDKD